MLNFHQEILFWVFFVFFNFLLFTINYILNYREADFFPFLKRDVSRGRGFFMHENQDFFRACVDISILFFVNRIYYSEVLVHLTSGYYVLIFLFNLYHYSFNHFYQTPPVILNDIKLLKNGVAYIWAESKLKVIVYSMLLLSLITFIYTAIISFLHFSQQIEINTLTYLGVFLFFTISTVAFIRKGYLITYDIYYRYLFFPLRINLHIKKSKLLKKGRDRVVNFELNNLGKPSFELAVKPNIHVLFIESYGSFLLKEPSFFETFGEKLSGFINDLKTNEWLSTSNTSESVSLIGPSWLCYSSVLLGKKIKNNYSYESLMYDDNVAGHPSLLKEFQSQGYTSYNINAGKKKAGIDVPYDQMNNLFGIDKWILREDIPYTGSEYGFTESPPDQFVLNYAFEEYLKKSNSPFVSFFLTKNSHTPFISPEFTTTDWRSLSNGKPDLIGANFSGMPKEEDYATAINYQLDFLKDFILNQGQKDDVFLLMGDHQPPFFAGVEKHGVETITHVISKNKDLISGFKKHGFDTDILKSISIRHEDVYSIFLKEIIRTYGANV